MTGRQPSRREKGHTGWTEARAVEHLRSVELFGMRFGLDRMRRMMTVLGSPQTRFETIHVLGTNGKSSTTRMIAAILERHGLRTGTYTSPHLVSYRERVQISEREIAPDSFAKAVGRAVWAAERVNRTLGEGDHVTQFELLTAAALSEMAEREVEVAVIEAGLGGRYDATSVIESRVTVLTNVGLEHTRWLGPTITDIAGEKLAALRPGATLVLGGDLAPEARTVAHRVAAEMQATVVMAPSDPYDGPMLALGAFQRRNFALAQAAAEAFLRSLGRESRGEGPRGQGSPTQGPPTQGPRGQSSPGQSSPGQPSPGQPSPGQGSPGQPSPGQGPGPYRQAAAGQAAATTAVPGRLQVVDTDPLTVLDGAHNPDAVRALVGSLGEVIGERPLALVLGVLEDKDAVRMLEMLLPITQRAWFTAPPSGRALSPAALESLARQLGFEQVVTEPRPSRALARAREWARESGAAVLATGSVYLVGELVGEFDGCDSLGRPAGGLRGQTT